MKPVMLVLCLNVAAPAPAAPAVPFGSSVGVPQAAVTITLVRWPFT